MVRVTDEETAWRTFRVLEQTGQVIYLQRFVKHPGWDLRAFVIGGKVIAAMKRTAANDWRTNVAQGGTAENVTLSDNEVSLALKAADAVGCPVAGVDLLPGPNGELFVIEVNAVPGWKRSRPRAASMSPRKSCSSSRGSTERGVRERALRADRVHLGSNSPEGGKRSSHRPLCESRIHTIPTQRDCHRPSVHRCP